MKTSIQKRTSIRMQGVPVAVLVANTKRALALAGTFVEVKVIRDKAEALRKYLKSVGAAVEDLLGAAEIKIRAERRMGAELRKLELHAGRPPKNADTMSGFSTLADLGVEEKQSQRWQLVDSIPEETFEAHIAEVREAKGELTTAGVIRIAKRLAGDAEVADIAAGRILVPEGTYRCLVVDPPWPMQKIEREVRPNQVAFAYPTMTEQELIDYQLVTEKTAEAGHLWLWTTQRFLPLAFRLVEVWGFDYLCTLTWCKPGGFQPVGLPQYSSEFILLARRAGLPFMDTKDFGTWFQAPRREHSRKPAEFYDLVRRVSPGPRIDMFCREKHEGFDQHGLEPDRFEEAIHAD
jgi:N6-adenosine-specific RNA methylase IME4